MAAAIGLSAIPAAAVEKPAEQGVTERLSSTDEGSPAANLTAVVNSLIAVVGLAFALAALVQGAATILGITPPPLPQLPTR
ncbi:hypothetical protein A0K93_08530 [Corynebacterium sp. BCW_4722]|nr:hypothetical protein A0K93_08530 [Corynebacterium sp. BCW_4722]